MLFGSAEKGLFPEKLTRLNEHGIPVRAVYLQAIVVTLLLVTTSLLPGVDTIYNVLVTMTALTSLFPYILLFLAYIKIKKRQSKTIDANTYVMTQNKKLAIGIAIVELIICTIAIVCSAYPVMDTPKDNIIYEIEMIGGGLLVIISGMYIWRHSKLKNKL